MKSKFVCALACPMLLLAACGDEVAEDPAVETGGKAAGEVLGGTISDDMLPLEELQSTSPPAARTPSDGGDGDNGGAGSQEADGSQAEPAGASGAAEGSEGGAPAEAAPPAPAEEG